jgi:hypothetical protein
VNSLRAPKRAGFDGGFWGSDEAMEEPSGGTPKV